MKEQVCRDESDESLQLYLSTQHVYLSVFENHPDAVYVLDPQGYFRHCNKQTYALLGYGKDDFVNQKIGAFTPGYDKQLLWDTFEKALRGDPQQFEFTTHHKDGHKLYLQTTFVPAPATDVMCVIGFCKDISDRVRMEEELRVSQERLARAHEIAQIGDWAIDLTTRTVECSEVMMQIYGLTNRTMPLGQALQSVHPHDRDLVEASIRRGIDEPSLVHDLEYRVVHVGGAVRHVHIHGKFTADNERPKLIGTAQDITNRKETEELLRQSDKLAVVGQLAAGVAHEIRNPLTVVKGLIQLLGAGPYNPVKQKAYHQIMMEALTQIEFITGEMLVLAKPQPENLSKNDVIKILREVVNLLTAEAHLHSVEVVCNINQEPIPIFCNANHIKQVFVNVVKNAIEAMPTGGTLNISVSTKDSQVLISITDTGHGVAPDRIKKLGEPFYTTKEKGTGLGLTVSNKILNDNHGLMRIESAVDRGTTVKILLSRIFE